MLDKPLLGSLARISDLRNQPFEVQRMDRDAWATGDYVVGEIQVAPRRQAIELCSGRLSEPMLGDHLIGALGVRAATLEVAGHWSEIGPDDQMHALTAAGLIGKATSVSSFCSAPLPLKYVGHCQRAGKKLTMRDFVDSSHPAADYDIPTILLIGTSMSSGKTTSAKVIIRQLVRAGLRVAGVKFTGAGRFRDILAMRDAGADPILDFVDAGLPSTVCPPEEYRAALLPLLRKLMAARPDVVVAEAGASPVEPYNGDTLMQMIRPQVRITVLCASDPYAVIGVQQGFGYRPDLIAGLATSTTAGVAVIEKLSGAKALNLLEPSALPALQGLLETKLSALNRSRP